MSEINRTKFKKIYNNLEDYPTITQVAEYFGKGETAIRDMARKLRNQGVNLVDRNRNAESILEFKRVYNDLVGFPTLESVAEELKVSQQTVRKMVRRMEVLGIQIASRSKDDVRAAAEKDKFENQYSRESLERVEKLKVKSGLYFITALELGAPVDPKFLASVEKFCEVEGAELVLLPMRSHAPFDENTPYDFRVAEKHLQSIYTELHLNGHLSIIELGLNSQQVLPLTGTVRTSQGNQSTLIAHSKQHLRMLPTGNLSLPKMQASTGAITIANYKNNRIGKIATKDHVVGGFIVDTNKDTFFTYQVQVDKKEGHFYWKNKRYSGSGVCDARVEALVLGDIHAGFTDPKAWKASEDQIKQLQPKEIYLHDLWEGISVSHHIRKNIGARSNIPAFINTLEKEIEVAKKFLLRINEIKPDDCTVYVVPSNHPDFLHRYLDCGEFVNDPVNYRKAVELAYAYHVLHKDPFQFALDPNEELAVWLKPDNDHETAGVATGHHGHKGVGGARGSTIGAEFAYGKYMGGHTHSPQILHGSFVVGTNSELRPKFVEGSPNTWIHCNGAIYPNGQRSLLFIIDGKWEA